MLLSHSVIVLTKTTLQQLLESCHGCMLHQIRYLVTLDEPLFGWRWQGFDLFMTTTCWIKSVYSMHKRPSQLQTNYAVELDTFLQFYEPASYHFLAMLGFNQINGKYQLGLLVETHPQIVICSIQSQKGLYQ